MTFQIPTDTYFNKQWHLLNNGQTGGRKGVDLNVLPVWEYYRGAGIKVGVYDNGTYVLHEDLAGNWNNKLQPIIDGIQFDPNPLLNPYREPVPDAHGTAVAGLIAAPINGIGVVGVAPEAKFGAMTVNLGQVGQIKLALALGQADAKNYILNLSMQSFKQFSLFDVVNHSYGSELFKNPQPTEQKQLWIDSIKLGRGGLGVLQVVSAGNEREEGGFSNDWTAKNMRQTIVAAAGSDLGDISYYSTPGPTVLVTAPVDVNQILGPQYPQWDRAVKTPPRILDQSTTTDIPGKANGYSGKGGDELKASLPPDYSYTTAMNGTSASAPMVSGVVSLMLDANPSLGYRDVQEILAISSRSPWQVGEYELFRWQTNGANYYNGGGFRYSHDYGFGFVDAAAAVRLSESWKQQRTSANEKILQGKNLQGETSIVLAAEIPATIDEKKSLTYTWNISSDITIEWVELQADITHSWWGDLNMTLTSPSGAKHTLLNRIGVSPGFVGPLNPNTKKVDLLGMQGTGVLNEAFASTVSRGESSIGQWKLEINGRSEGEGGSGGVGVLKSLQLSLFGSESPGSSYENTPTYYYTDRYAELLKLEPKRRNKLEGDFGKNAALNFAASSEKVIVDLSDTQAQLADLFIPIANSSEIHTVFGGGAGDKLTAARQGSSLYGGWGDDQLFGSMGSDFLSGGRGDDLIHGGIGADVITGGVGRDELHGDFGRNTYRSEKDGVSDLIAIKSDQFLVNWLYGQAGNSPNGEKSDIIEGLDLIDKIRIIGIDTSEISFAADVATKGVTGIGIYGKGILEALYTGGDLTLAQIQSMTSGDASAAAMSNSVNAYGTW